MRIRGVRLGDRLSCLALRQRLGIEDMYTLVTGEQHRLRWYGHILKDDEERVKNVELLRLRGQT